MPDSVSEAVVTKSVALETIDPISGITELVDLGTCTVALETTGTASGMMGVLAAIEAVGARAMMGRALVGTGAGTARTETPKDGMEINEICILESGRLGYLNDVMMWHR